LSNAFLLYVAGTETVSNAATFTVYELAKQPQITTKLAEELSVFKSVHDFTTVNLEHLPLMNAVIREGLRLYSPVGGPGGREAPPEGVQMGGYYIPGGVRISENCLSCRLLYPGSLILFVAIRTFIPNRLSSDQKGI
jgi:cytochrome P450